MSSTAEPKSTEAIKRVQFQHVCMMGWMHCSKTDIHLLPCGGCKHAAAARALQHQRWNGRTPELSSQLFSAAVRIRLTAALWHCKYTYGNLLFIQLCSDATPMHCSIGQCKISSPLFSAAVRIRLTAALCHCEYTYGDLLFIQLCSDATPMHCSTGQGKLSSPLFSAAVRIRLTAALSQCKYTYGDLVFTQVYSDATPMHCSTGQGKIASSLFCAALQNRLTAGIVSLQIHLWRFALHTGVQ